MPPACAPRWPQGPRRVLIVGAGLIGCEAASCCRDLGLPVTLVDPEPDAARPFARHLGRRRDRRVPAGCRRGRSSPAHEVLRFEGDASGRVVRAHLADGSAIEADLVIVALGATRATDWLAGAGLMADPGGVTCDARLPGLHGAGATPCPDIYAAGDVARWPNPLYGGRLISVEHWGNAVAQAAHAARNMLAPAEDQRPYDHLPAFWSSQFGINIKAVGLSEGADAVAIVQGSRASRRFLAVYGRAGRSIAAVSFDQARWLPAYAEAITAGEPFPPILDASDQGRLPLPGTRLPAAACRVHAPARPVMAEDTLFSEVLDPANRADPYPIYARLRETPGLAPARRQLVVSSHAAIRSLIFDPRLSSEDLPPSHRPRTGNPLKDWLLNPIKDRIATAHRPLIFRDPPDHDTLRHVVMREFSVARVQALRQRVVRDVDALIDACRGTRRGLPRRGPVLSAPVSVICDMLGVPEADEPQFQAWATQLATALEPDARHDEASRHRTVAAFDAISGYMRALIREKRRRPAADMLSALAAPGPRRQEAVMGDFDLISTAILLLVAGHETTVNLITNGMLTLLRHPQELERLRADPERAPRVIEELLRYEPPVHFRTRKALGAIEIAGETIPKGAPVILLFAAANRDPARFADPDRFDPDREDNQHFGFGGGLHYCMGAPLARIEAEIALVALCRRLVAPRLMRDPPPYRPGASLRGPEELRIAIDAVA